MILDDVPKIFFDNVFVECQNGSKSEPDRFVRLIYLVCNDVNGGLFDEGRFQGDDADGPQSNSIESGCQRIATAARLAQYFFWKTVGKTFRLERNPDSPPGSEPMVHRFLICDGNYDRDKLCHLTQRDLWRLVADQLMNNEQLGSEHCKYLAFCSFSRYERNDSEPWWQPAKQVKGYVSLGGDGLALLSTHCLYCWPKNLNEVEERFQDQRKVDRHKFMDDSDNRNTLSGCFSSTFGAMLHELAHTFNLGHREQSGIMWRRFNKIDEFFINNQTQPEYWWSPEDLIILQSNPWFNTKPSKSKCRNIFSLNMNRQILQSEYGLRLVEYRHVDTDLVIHTKVFDFPIRIYKLSCSSLDNNSRFKLFVMDQLGNTKLFHCFHLLNK